MNKKYLIFLCLIFTIMIKSYCQKLTYFNTVNRPDYPVVAPILSMEISSNGDFWICDPFKLVKFDRTNFSIIPITTSKLGENNRFFKIYSIDSAMYFISNRSDTLKKTGGIVRLKSNIWESYNNCIRSPISTRFYANYDPHKKKINISNKNEFSLLRAIYPFDINSSTFSVLRNNASGPDSLSFIPDRYINFNSNFYGYTAVERRSEIRITNGINFFSKIKLKDAQGRKRLPSDFFQTDTSSFYIIGTDSVINPEWSTRIFRCDTIGCIDITQSFIGDTTITEARLAPNGDLFLGISGLGFYVIKKKGRRIKVIDFGNQRLASVSNFNFESNNTKWFAAFGDLVKMTDVNCQFQPIQKSGCKGQTLSFASKTTTIGDGIKTYIWKFGNNLAQTLAAAQGDTVRFTFSNPGTYRVKLIAIDSNGITDSSFQQISILNSPGVQLNIGDSLVSCKTSINLSAFNGTKPTWYFPDGSTILNTQSIVTKGVGLYIVKDTLTIDSISCYSSDSVRLIKRRPSLGSLELSNSINGNTISTDTIYSNDIKSILISGTPQGSTFSMVVNGDNLKKNPAIVSTDSLDKLEIFYTVKDQDSCQFYVSKTVYIKTKIVVPEPPKPEFIPNLPNLITANNDAFNQSFTDKTGSFPTGYTLEIFNRWGQSIFKKDNYQNEWPETATKEGLYFYLLTSPTGTKYTGWADMMR